MGKEKRSQRCPPVNSEIGYNENMNSVRRNDGFTLMELLIAIALILILAGMTLPRFSRGILVGTEVEATMNQIAATLRLAKKLARSHGKDYRVRFSTPPTFTSYAIQEQVSGAQYRDENHTIPSSVTCQPAGSGANALQDVVFLSKKGARILDSSGNDIADSTYHSLSCSGGTKSGTITLYVKTGRIELSLTP